MELRVLSSYSILLNEMSEYRWNALSLLIQKKKSFWLMLYFIHYYNILLRCAITKISSNAMWCPIFCRFISFHSTWVLFQWDFFLAHIRTTQDKTIQIWFKLSLNETNQRKPTTWRILCKWIVFILCYKMKMIFNNNFSKCFFQIFQWFFLC